MSSKISKIGSAIVAAATLVLFGCGSSGSPGSSTSASIGAAGGTLKIGRVALSVPANALSGDVRITVREAEPRHVGRAARVEVEPSGLRLAQPAMLSVKIDDSNPRVKLVSDDGQLAQVEVEDHAHHAFKTSVSQLGALEVEVEHGVACAATCAANEECDDGVCKPHDEHAVACDAVCASGLECDDGACKPHGGGAGGTAGATACDPGCASGLECDDGICKPHGGTVTPGPGAACDPACAAGFECDNGVCQPHKS